MTVLRRAGAEALGTALLLAVVIGSGVMAERLSGGNTAVALLANTLATVFGLYVLIEVLAPLSGAHFNPAVSLAMAWRGALPRADLVPYLLAQGLGAALGAWLAHAMFELPILQLSSKLRDGPAQWLAAPRRWWRPTSARLTGSPRQPRSPTRRRCWGACSATPLPALRRPAHPPSWRPN